MKRLSIRRQASVMVGLLLAMSACTAPVDPAVEDSRDERPRRNRVESTFNQPRQPWPERTVLSDEPVPQGDLYGDSNLSKWIVGQDWLLICGGDDPTMSEYRGTIVVSVPPGRQAYFVKLRARGSGDLSEITLFIHPGQTIRRNVPTCYRNQAYDLYFGAGRNWYGWEHAFGPRGSYAKADQRFAFSDGTVWKVSLSAEIGGNLSTSGIGYADFQ